MSRKFDHLAAWIPFYGQWRTGQNVIHNIKTNGFQLSDLFGFWKEEPSVLSESADSLLGDVTNSARDEFLADREHTEMREDTAYQRGVADRKAAGLSPYTIGATPSPSSASSVGENSIMTKLQVVGSILDLQNLSNKNKSLVNNIIGTALNGYLRSKGL